MSKGTMLAMVLGVVSIAVGVVLTIVWRWDVWMVIKGVLGPPFCWVACWSAPSLTANIRRQKKWSG
jgi:hypothetical protein